VPQEPRVFILLRLDEDVDYTGKDFGYDCELVKSQPRLLSELAALKEIHNFD